MGNGTANRPAPELLRAHCQVFSRLGWALFLQLAVMAVVQAAAGFWAALAAPDLLSDPLFLWLLSVLSVYGAGLPAFCLVLRGAPPLPAAEPRPLSPGRFFQVLVVCLGATYLLNLFTLALLELVGQLLGAPVRNPVEQMESYPALLNVLLGCVIAPAAEEFIFRGQLLGRLRPYGERFALPASALCFGLFHGNLSQFFYASAIGLVLGWVALRTGRLWQPILLHALVNSVSTVLVPLLEPFGAAGDAALSALVLGSIGLGALFFAELRREPLWSDAPGPLPLRWAWRVFFESPGVACFLLLALALCAAWLF